MARSGGSWLDGPIGDQSATGAGEYAGQRLGLPPQGPRSVAGTGQRLAAVVIDWFIAILIASAATRTRPFTPGRHSSATSWLTLGIFALEYLILVSLIGRTIGMRLVGIAVVRLDGGRVSLPWVAVRTLLLLLVVPAFVFDRDRRGLHDKAAACVVVRL